MQKSATLLNSTVRHAVQLERLKAGEVNQFASFLKRIDVDLRERLTRDDITTFSRTRLEKQLRGVEKSLSGIFSDYYDELAGHLTDLSEYESEFESRNLENAAESSTFEAVIPAPEQVRAAVFSSPLSVRGANGGKLLEPFVKDWTKSDTKFLSGAIRQGFFEGLTNFEILRNLRGTKANRFSDGALATVNRHANAIVRTAVQHTASTARMQTWIANGITKYQWVSTLDGRTSTICRSLDREVFDIGKGPLPPIHISCRSVTAAKLSSKFDFLDEGATRASKDGPVDAKLGYYDWLKQQSGDFQDDVLGPVRGKLFRDGGISTDRFKKLQLDKNFRPLTLDEMRKRESSAFSRLDEVDIVTEVTAREYVVSNGRKFGGEFAYAGNPETGDFIFKKRGDRSSVSFTSREVDQLKRKPGAVMYHNHPSGSSLSRADLEFSATTNLKEIVAFATKEQGEFRASINLTAANIVSMHERADDFVRSRMWPLIRNKTVSFADAEISHAHIVNELLNKSGAIDYKAVQFGAKMDKSMERMKPFLKEWLDDYDPS